MATLNEAPRIDVEVVGSDDVERVRRDARTLATSLGFSLEESESLALAVSELGTNLIRYATNGHIDVSTINDGSAVGVVVECRDGGPGIVDTEAALRDGFSTAGGLGAGLGGVRRLMDDFHIASGPGGTTIVCHKWHRQT
jgi:serine/threonine-protein kinase RsbT